MCPTSAATRLDHGISAGSWYYPNPIPNPNSNPNPYPNLLVGRSAGGLLIGATANRVPHLFKALVADVPFVDVMTTMADPSIPLTTTEVKH